MQGVARLDLIQARLNHNSYKNSKMSTYPVKGTVRQSKSKNLDYCDPTSNLEQSLKLLDQLFQARLIDKIARPIDKKVKQEHIDRYRTTLDVLHDRLKKIKGETTERHSVEGNLGQGNLAKNKSVLGSTTHKPNEWSKHIRSIQSKYTETILEGSYKYLKTICRLLALRYDSSLEPINIEIWASVCLQTTASEACC